LGSLRPFCSIKNRTNITVYPKEGKGEETHEKEDFRVS